METIVYELLHINQHFTKPGLHFLSYKGMADVTKVTHYMHVQIVYEHLNQVQYTKLEYNSTDQSCSRFQFHAGYQTGGKDHPKINPDHKHSICVLT